jgi:hypothetical protein
MYVIITLVLALLFALLFVVPAVIAVRDMRSGRADPGTDDAGTTAW